MDLFRRFLSVCVLFDECRRSNSTARMGRFHRLTAKNIPRARKAFKEFQGTHLAADYPEAVCEAWISFEERWGTAKELEDALSHVRKLTDALNEKRAKVSHFNVYLPDYLKQSGRMHTACQRLNTPSWPSLDLVLQRPRASPPPPLHHNLQRDKMN